MLIFERKLNESVCIGDDVVVMICGIDVVTRKVKLGIRAPRDVIVDREEIAERRKEGKR